MNNSQFNFVLSDPINNNLTEEQKNILKILSNGSDLQYQELIRNSSDHIERLVKLYNQRKPLIDDLNNHGFEIQDLSSIHFSQYDDETFKKSLPTLIEWLKKKNLSYHVKDAIIDILIQRPIAKKYALDIILNELKTADKSYKDEWGYPSPIFLTIGNALLRWIDDENALEIFDFLNDKKLKEDNFILASVANFKKTDNVEKAKNYLINELQNKSIDRDRLFTVISTLRRLKLNSPKNLVALIKPYSSHKDNKIRNETKMTIAKLEKISH